MDGDADVSLFFLTRRKNELEFGIEPEDLGGGHTDIVGPYEEWRSTYEAIKAEKVLRMEFSSPEEARKFYNDYSRVKGFATRQGKKIKNISGKIVRYTFVCNREGFRHKKWLEKSDRK
ncbi:protein FAR1-RELATED SEQUENCE 12-like [Arachis ipaensis]|nr:protein FAR1-RELATED SEQUENCE 12-like [Arachis ipaensis]